MKFLILIVTLLSFNVMAENNLDHPISQIEKRLTNYSQNKTPHSPINLSDNKFWLSTILAYDHLKAYNLQERYNFLYDAARAYTNRDNVRIKNLKAWITRENHKIQAKKLPPHFFTQWNAHLRNINRSVLELEQDRQNVPKSNINDIAILKDIQNDLAKVRAEQINLFIENQGLKNKIADETSTRQASSVRNYPIKNTNKMYLLKMFTKLKEYKEAAITIVSTIMLFLFIEFFISRFKKKETRISSQGEENTPNFPPSLEMLNNEGHEIYEMNQSEETDDYTGPAVTTDIEAACLQILESNHHFLEAAKLDVNPYIKSPFQTKINISSDKVNEALYSFFKGTLSIINSAPQKAESLDVNCITKDGRVYIQFNIRGIEFDEKLLYYNVLVDGTTSAPAHFGRAERVLEDHAASIVVTQKYKKLQLTLGLDASKNTMSYC